MQKTDKQHLLMAAIAVSIAAAPFIYRYFAYDSSVPHMLERYSYNGDEPIHGLTVARNELQCKLLGRTVETHGKYYFKCREIKCTK